MKNEVEFIDRMTLVMLAGMLLGLIAIVAAFHAFK